tara:strand:- start:889 stop:1251 length:363 start_codon:yes stop_codon:yes gene_type:complete
MLMQEIKAAKANVKEAGVFIIKILLDQQLVSLANMQNTFFKSNTFLQSKLRLILSEKWYRQTANTQINFCHPMVQNFERIPFPISLTNTRSFPTAQLINNYLRGIEPRATNHENCSQTNV